MVELVLDDARVEPLELEPERRPGDVLRLEHDGRRPLDRDEHTLKGKAPLVVGLELVARLRRSAG